MGAVTTRSTLDYNVSPMLPDTVVGHYRILRPLGKGGMGEVYCSSAPAPGTRIRIYRIDI